MKVSKLKFIQTCTLVAGLAIAQFAFANVAGNVTFAAGDVSVTRADKSVKKLAKNDALNVGDTIETKEGRAQLTLIDGGKVSLQPNSIYRINKYTYSGKEDGSEYAFTELIKGGLRTISGAIGHKNRDRYQLKTAVATIGIRGTEFTVNYNDNLLLMTTNFGSVDVCNDGGCLNALSGQTIAVTGGSTPKFSSKAAKTAAAPPASSKSVFSASDTPITLPAPDMTVVSLAASRIGNVRDEIFTAPTQFDASNQLTRVGSGGSGRLINTGLSFSSFNSDGVVSWGQSNGGQYTASGPNTVLTKYDYIAGTTTSPTSLATLTGSYNVFASTAPFSVVNGVTSSAGLANTTTGNLSFNFTNLTLGYNLAVTANSEIYTLTGGGSLVAGNPNFASNGIISSNGTSCSGANCTGALQGGNIIQGSLLGANGERIGLQYGIQSPGLGGNIYGGAVLK